MNGKSEFIQQFYPARPQVSDVRVCGFGFIQPDIPRRRAKLTASQGVTALSLAVLSRRCGMRACGVTSTLRCIAGK